EIGSGRVRVSLAVDKGLEKIMQDDPLIHQQLADAGIKVLQDNRAKAQQRIKEWDRQPDKPEDLQAMNEELKKFCAGLARDSEKDARDAIEKQWRTIQGRQQARLFPGGIGFNHPLSR